MKYVLLIIGLGLVVALFYWAYMGEAAQRHTQRSVQGVVEGVVHSGREVGKGASKAFDKVDFGGK